MTAPSKSPVPHKDAKVHSAYAAARVRRARAAWFAANGPCVRCRSRKNLQLDHIDPKKKVSHRIFAWTPQRRNAELAKCQVLCAECHKKKTAADCAPPHGTNGRYTGRCRCRCIRCRAAHAIVNARYRNKQT